MVHFMDMTCPMSLFSIAMFKCPRANGSKQPGVDSLAEGLVVLAERTTTGLSAVDDQLIKADSWSPWLWYGFGGTLTRMLLNIKNHQILGFPVVLFPLSPCKNNSPMDWPVIGEFITSHQLTSSFHKRLSPTFHFSGGVLVDIRDAASWTPSWL